MVWLRYAYAPLFFATFVGGAVALFGAGRSAWVLLPLLLAAIAASFVVERLIPYEPAWNRDHGDRARDAAHAIVNEAGNIATVLAVPTFAALVPATGLWPNAWPLGFQLALAVLVADMGITLAHYASHRSERLWRMHAIHHSVRRLYGFNGLMKHPLHQAIEVTAGTAPLLVVGMPQGVAWLLAFAVAVQLLLQHSNADVRMGPLRYVWAIAPVHRLHHRRTAAEGNVNFGLFTTLWDVALGTACFHPARPVRAGDLGMADAPDFPQRYLEQLAAPFRGGG